MGALAFTAVIAEKPKDGMHYSLGIAEENIPGYSPVKETGEPDDPFFVSKFPTRFNTYKEAQEQAKKLNEEMLHISEYEALLIVASTMSPR